MDQNQRQMLESASRFKKCCQFFKKTLQLLVPVSLLSFLLSNTTDFSLFFCNIHFSTLLFPLFTHTLERKYMFLICNGILAFLVRNLSFSSSSPTGSELDSEFPESKGDCLKLESELSKMKEAPLEDNEAIMENKIVPLENVNVAVVEEEPEGQEQEDGSSNTQVKEIENRAVIVDSEDNSEEEEEEEEEEDEELEHGVSLIAASPAEAAIEAKLTTDELNKKFEEFIRKMKEEIRIEARQQLIAV